RLSPHKRCPHERNVAAAGGVAGGGNAVPGGGGICDFPGAEDGRGGDVCCERGGVGAVHLDLRGGGWEGARIAARGGGCGVRGGRVRRSVCGCGFRGERGADDSAYGVDAWDPERLRILLAGTVGVAGGVG